MALMDGGKSWTLTLARVSLGTVVFVHDMANSSCLWGGSQVESLTADVASQLSQTPNAISPAVA